jgi:RNA polymerase primary sigma factor
MLDIVKYKEQINKIIKFVEEFHYVTISYIYNVFKNPNDELLEDIIEYLESIDIEIIKDDNKDEPSDDELLAGYFLDVINVQDNGSDNYISTGDLIKSYLNDISKIPLLDFQMEVECAKNIQIGNKAEAKLAKRSDLSEEEIKYYEDLSSKGIEARQLLIESNLRLVVSIAKHFINRGLTLMDLIQEGNIGLIRAVYKYDPSKGFRFSTYATWWIRQAISRATADKGRIVRLPVHMVDAVNKMNKDKSLLIQKLQREPTNEELAEFMGIEVSKLDYIIQISQETLSLDQTIDDEEEGSLGELISDNSFISPSEYFENQMYKQRIDKMLKTLNPREERIIRLRYGLEDNIIHTLEEIGKEYGITRERVRQIEVRAIRRLRHPARIKILKDK